MIVIPKTSQRKPVTTHSITRFIQPNFPVTVALEQDHEGFFFFVFGETGDGETWMVPPTTVYTSRLVALSESDWLGVASIAYATFTEAEIAAMQITRDGVNERLKQIGIKAELMRGEDYYYLIGRDANHLESKVILASHMGCMEFDEWVSTIIKMVEAPTTALIH